MYLNITALMGHVHPLKTQLKSCGKLIPNLQTNYQRSRRFYSTSGYCYYFLRMCSTSKCGIFPS